MTLAALVGDPAARSPGRRAVVTDAGHVTYAELDARVARAAGALHEQGVRTADPVAFTLANTLEALTAFHAALRLGAVAVPLNPLLAVREVHERLAESRARHVEVGGLDGTPLEDLPAVAPGDPAVILYTSGTTGAPKRIELTHGELRSSAEATAEALGLLADDVVLGAVPLAHVFGLTGCMNAAFAAEACLALLPRFDAEEALAAIERAGVTVFMGVPTMCAALVAASCAKRRAPALRLAHVGGAPLPLETLRAFERRFGAVVLEGYGMTEVGGAIAVQRADRPRKPGSVGVPLTAKIAIATDGEVLVRRRGDWLPTGDIGRLDDDGDLFLVDRKKEVILRGGYTVYPREVEEALLAHAAVREAVVVGVPHPVLGEEVAALVVADGADADEVSAFARGRLAAYKYPRLVAIVDDLPRGPTGKVQRREIDRAALAERLRADRPMR